MMMRDFYQDDPGKGRSRLSGSISKKEYDDKID